MADDAATATGLLDLLASLTAIMEEETDLLVAPGRHPQLPELAAAKARLVSTLEARIVALNREAPGWAAALAPDIRDRVAASVNAMGEAAVANGRVLKRQIDLTTDMMAAVAAEARRLTGGRGATYGIGGALSRGDQATPISLNARL